ncbi:MAG: polysaccharide biosynthesis/export family protein [Rikenellaceae bacterium]
MKKLILIFFVALMASCATQKKIVYFQDAQIDSLNVVVSDGVVRFSEGDRISIIVSSRNPELAAVFNLPKVTISGTSGSKLSTGSSEQMTYIVDASGEIDFPVLGKVKIEGLTREEVKDLIQSKILESGMVKDPIVTVMYYNLRFSVLGEISKPGVYDLENDRTTILEALSKAGDLTINSVRDGVHVLREDKEGKVITYALDMRSMDIYKSPAFYIEPGDVIYVRPNITKTNQSTINGNTVRSTSFWMSLASFMMTISLLFIN